MKLSKADTADLSFVIGSYITEVHTDSSLTRIYLLTNSILIKFASVNNENVGHMGIEWYIMNCLSIILWGHLFFLFISLSLSLLLLLLLSLLLLLLF